MSDRVGVDTTFLVEAEVREAPNHSKARRYLEDMVFSGKVRLALAPQVLTEFAHVVTDPRRFSRPLEMTEAVVRAGFWWRAREVIQVFPGSESTHTFLDWMRAHRLGRKRLLDTHLAATYDAAGIRRIVSSSGRGA
jgi:predicted nucleic acid-binding protein